MSRRQFHPVVVREVVDETHDAKSFVVEIPTGLADQFVYAPGQYVTVRAEIDGDEVYRCYSMSSTPTIDPHLQFTVKRVSGGLMSNWLHDHVVPGSQVHLQVPAGVFVEDPGEAPILAFCGGSGVTPVYSIVKHALAHGQRRIRVFFANRDRDSVIFRTGFDQLVATHPERLTVHHHVDTEAGFATADDVARFVGDDTDAQVLICGPGPFMDLVETGVAAAGIASDRIAIERFENAAAPATPDGAVAGHDDVTTEQVTIHLKGKRATVDYKPGDTVLETARRGGMSPPFSCLAGNCATCMAMLTTGTVEMRVNDVLTDDELAEGWVLTCQSIPTSPEVTVDYDA